MGICEYQLAYVEEQALPHVVGKRMLELGDQVLNPGLAKRTGVRTGKQLYEMRGWDHVSMDLNGMHGAVVADLTTKHREFNRRFDIITNHGTSEHIRDQYSLFGNLHAWGDIGCVYVHVVPLCPEEHVAILGRPFPEHGFWEYGGEFWRRLCKACHYTLLSVTSSVRNAALSVPVNHYSSCVYVKGSSSHYIREEKFRVVQDALTRKSSGRSV
jgi:hypothetical protein